MRVGIVRKLYRDLNNQDNIWIQIFESAQRTGNHLGDWNIKHQTNIGWNLIMK
jgi:K+/H+ antiporter YhaU regulatory subunit KhtT